MSLQHLTEQAVLDESHPGEIDRRDSGFDAAVSGNAQLSREVAETAGIGRVVVDVQQHSMRALERLEREGDRTRPPGRAVLRQSKPRVVVVRTKNSARVDSADCHIDRLGQRVEPQDFQLDELLRFPHEHLRLTKGDLRHARLSDTKLCVGQLVHGVRVGHTLIDPIELPQKVHACFIND
eukprot:scaffold83945_cov67-Phaeocystis_antarctica.AAC.6